MRSSRWKLSLLVVLVSACAALPGTALADPLASKRAQADAVMEEIRNLDASVSKAVDAYNAARIRLDQIQEEQRANRRHLELAKTNFGRAQGALQARLLALYTSGSPSSLEILLGAVSLDDLITRAETVSRVSAEDTRIVGEIRKFRTDMKSREKKLAQANADQQNVVADLEAQRRAIESQLAERRRLLSTIESEIERIKAAEERKQARLRALAEQRIASNPPSGGGGGDDGEAAAASGGASESSGGGGSAPPPRHGGVVGIAMQYLGVPYRWGGASPSGFDCSGFIMYVFAKVGVSLPHNAAMQYGYGSPVSRSQLAPGDLVFFNGLGHNGIYIGGGSFIHSPHTGDVVKISSLYDSWYARTYVGARRM